jgi:hypothetical protein
MERAQVAQTGEEIEGVSAEFGGRGPFGLATGFAAVALALLAVFQGAEWYADQVSMPRYCADPDAAIERLHEILSQSQPVSDGSMRPYVVAAKLLYLIPQDEGEADEAYLARLRLRIAETCR